MGTLVVRNIGDNLIAKLERRAARNKRSAEAEHRAILEAALGGEPRRSFRDVAANLRAATAGRRHTPSEELLREGSAQR